MKTYRALILPVLLATMAASRTEAQAQYGLGPGGPQPPASTASIGDSHEAAPALAPTAQGVPLGLPSTLGAPPPRGGAMPPGGFAPASFQAPGPMMGMPPGGPMVAPAGMGQPMMAPGAMAGPAGPGGPAMGPGGMPSMQLPPYGVMPAGYEMGAMGGSYAQMGGCPSCGGGGCPNCMGSGGSLGDRVGNGFDLLRYLLPYSGGGWTSPRWYDFSADYVSLRRDDVGTPIGLISDGNRGLGEPNIVLGTNDLEFDYESGFRASGAIQFGPSGSIEFTYLGTHNWADEASVTSDFDELFSIFSDFGTQPPPTVVPVITRGGFTDTDSAEFASIEYSSAINSYDLGFRRRWTFPHSRLQGSWIAGARYFRLEEEFRHLINVNYADPNDVNGIDRVRGALDYIVATDNSMTGFQLGGDLWATLIPGLQVGVDGRAGIYGNRARQATFIDARSLAEPFEEREDSVRASFVGEASAQAVWRVTQHLSLRGGGELIYVDGVALAPENFNAGPPFVSGARTIEIVDGGDVLYYGFTGGLEWMW